MVDLALIGLALTPAAATCLAVALLTVLLVLVHARRPWQAVMLTGLGAALSATAVLLPV